MKVCGFSFIRNAIKYDYPIREALLSIAPLCDKIFVAVGQSEDETMSYIEKLLPEKIIILPTIWNDDLREGGRVLALETNKAYQSLEGKFDWCIYIQGDEVIHEKDYQEIQASMSRFQNMDVVEGLLFKYKHFYGSYDYVATSSNWYKNEIRIIRQNKKISSYKDAQGFRWTDDRKLNVKAINASIYHYGWVKPPKAMQDKQKSFNKYWHDDQWIDRVVGQAEDFDYSQIDRLQRFEDSHPKVMKDRISAQNWKFDYDISMNKTNFKQRVKDWSRKALGIEFGEYKNYKLI